MYCFFVKGSYVLLVYLDQEKVIKIGSLGEIIFNKGWYVYVGSALYSIEKRIQRHIAKEKKLHWHIDYLLKYADVFCTFYKESTSQEECMIADAFQQRFKSIPHFGCSDCHCPSHLFTGSYEPLCAVAALLGMKKLVHDAKP